ncbi:HAMP domain-containing histidine kinase, partial [candidate division KSB1 bacterium]|nr:HAMP domain-containing histidine kinase [candidate division KSB1 bacterium]
PKEHRYYHYIGKIEKEIQRIAKIVRHMLDLYKPGHSDLNEFRASEALQDVVALLKTDARNDKVQIVLDVQNATTRVRLPENTLRQIMYNLILNAIEASPPDGVVRIAATVSENCLQVTVSDQGPGIPEAIRTRIFEPFFTTKGASDKSGLGFGLTICKSLVESMNGTLELTSRCGQGAVFKISLPINASTAGQEEERGFSASRGRFTRPST